MPGSIGTCLQPAASMMSKSRTLRMQNRYRRTSISKRPRIFNRNNYDYHSSVLPPSDSNPLELAHRPENDRTQSDAAAPAHTRDFREKRSSPPVRRRYLQDAAQRGHRHRARNGLPRADSIRTGRSIDPASLRDG